MRRWPAGTPDSTDCSSSASGPPASTAGRAAPPRSPPSGRTSSSTSAPPQRSSPASGGAKRRGQPAEAGSLTVRLPLRPPYDADAVLGWLGNRAVAGIEEVDGGSYRRTLTLPGGTGTVTLKPSASVGGSAGARTRLGT